MRGVNEVRAVILVPLVLAEPLLRSIAIPLKDREKKEEGEPLICTMDED